MFRKLPRWDRFYLRSWMKKGNKYPFDGNTICIDQLNEDFFDLCYEDGQILQTFVLKNGKVETIPEVLSL